MLRNVARGRFVGVLLVLSLVGIMAVLYAVPMGAGGMWDSVAYIGTARNLAGGIGFYLAHRLPRAAFTHWAPLYPMILAVPARFGVDPADAARWVNAIAFGCSIFFAGFLAWAYCCRSYVFGFLAALLILFSSDLIEIHSQVLSDPLFIALMLASITALLSYVETGKITHMVAAAIAIAMALLTRYAGGFLPIVAIIIITLTWQNLKQRGPISVSSFALALMIVILPFGAWTIRNMLVTGMPVEQHLVYHPIGLRQLGELFRTVSLWFIPTLVYKYVRFVILMGLLVLVFGILVSALRDRRRAVDQSLRSTALLAGTCFVCTGVYLSYLFVTISFFDASTPLDTRLLSPMHAVAALLLVSSLALSREMFGRKSLLYRALLGICLWVVVLNAARFVGAIRHIRANGVGFQTADWRDDAIMTYVRDLPDNAALYTDDPARIYYATGRSPYVLPAKFSIGTNLANREFDSQMKSLADLGTKRTVVVVLFASGWVNGPFALPPELAERWGFHSILHSAKGAYILSVSSAVSDR